MRLQQLRDKKPSQLKRPAIRNFVIVMLILQADSQILLNVEEIRLTISRSRRPDLSANHRVTEVARTWMTNRCVYLSDYVWRILERQMGINNLSFSWLNLNNTNSKCSYITRTNPCIT